MRLRKQHRVWLTTDHQLATVARDLPLFLCGHNLNLVRGEPKKVKAVRCRGPNTIAVLPDAPGEDKKVHAAQQSHIGPDRFSYRDGKDIQRKTGVWIIGAGTLFQRLHIALARRESEKPA